MSYSTNIRVVKKKKIKTRKTMDGCILLENNWLERKNLKFGKHFFRTAFICILELYSFGNTLCRNSEQYLPAAKTYFVSKTYAF